MRIDYLHLPEDGYINNMVNDIIERFYVINLHSLSVKYNVNTGELISVRYDGRDIPLDIEVLHSLNKALDSVNQNSKDKKNVEEPKFIFDDLIIPENSLFDEDLNNGTSQCFSFLPEAWITIKITYNTETHELIKIELNAEELPITAETIKILNTNIKKSNDMSNGFSKK